MTRFALQVKTALSKERHPEHYCPTKGCLWRTGGGYCPRHQPKDPIKQYCEHLAKFWGKVAKEDND